MSKIDEELARAVGDDVGAEAPPVVRTQAAPVGPPRPKKNLGLLLGLFVIMAALLGLVFSFQDAAIYAKTVSQLMADRARLAGRPVRVEGDLVKGTLVHQDSPCEYNFRIAEKGVELPVRYANCVVPETFREMPGMDLKVTVEGKLSPEGKFEATLIMAKCPSKYDMKQKAANGEAAPHAAMPESP